jgi:hypothetical protein
LDDQRQLFKTLANGGDGFTSTLKSIIERSARNSLVDEKERKDKYAKFLLDRFETHLFKSDDIQKLLEAAVKTHLASLDGMDNQLLVNLRADIDDDLPTASLVIRALRSEKAFREAYSRAKDHITPLLNAKLKESVALEMLSFVAGDLAARLAVRVGAAVATRLGVSSGILASGAAASVATFGVSVLACIMVDAAIDEIMKRTGNDPEEKVAARIGEILDGVRESLVDGNAEAQGVYKLALKLAILDPELDVRVEAHKTVRAVEAGGALGLKRELIEYTKARSAQRRAALEKLFKGTSTEVER